MLALPAAMAPTCITKLSPVRSAMLDSVFKALADIFTEPFSEVLIKSVVLALALLVAIFMAHGSQTVTLGGGLFAAAVMLMPAVTALVASFSADEIADLKRFPTDLNRWDSQKVRDERVFGH